MIILFYLIISVSILHKGSGQGSSATMPPSILTNNDAHLVFYLYELLQLQYSCVATGIPAPSYTLYKDNVSLGSSTSGNFSIPFLDSSAEGIYNCLAHNAFGTSMTNFTWAQLGIASRFANVPDYNISLSNSRLSTSIDCNSPLYRPNATYSWWYSDNTQVIENNEVQIDQITGNIYFSTATNYLNRFMVCRADVPGAQFTSSRTQISAIATSDNIIPLQLQTSSPNFLIALERQAFFLRCLFSGYPTPSPSGGYFWFKNGIRQQIPVDNWVTSRSGTYLNTTTVIKKDFEGTYTCEATNSAGTVSYTITLQVESAPIFLSMEDQPYNVNISSGNSITFRCNAYANPIATIRWFRNAQLLNPASLPNKYSLSDDLQFLTVNNPCKVCDDGSNDLAVIQCNASNVHGFAFAQGYLNVVTATQIAQQDENIDWVANQVYTFICDVVSSDDIAPVTQSWYFKNNSVVNSNVYLISADAKSLTVMTNNSRDGGLSLCGPYMCLATNGASTDTVTYDLRGPEPESLWWISLIVLAILLLLLLLFLLCFFCIYKNEGRSYPVDKNEKSNGNNPEKELNDLDFKDFQTSAPSFELPPYNANGMNGIVNEAYITAPYIQPQPNSPVNADNNSVQHSPGAQNDVYIAQYNSVALRNSQQADEVQMLNANGYPVNAYPVVNYYHNESADKNFRDFVTSPMQANIQADDRVKSPVFSEI